MEKTNHPTCVPLVIGIGLSSGKDEAVKKFFSSLPPDSGMIFILVQQAQPEQTSLSLELLANETPMRVRQAETGMALEPNQIFVIPSGSRITVVNGHFTAEPAESEREYCHPIDSFFFSLAKDQGEKAVCVILSGKGSAGSFGTTTIKEHGGLTIAQAAFDHVPVSGMPGHAVESGEVDFILPVSKMPAKLLEYQHHLTQVQPKKDLEGTRNDIEEYLPEIFSLLQIGVGHDFSHYKIKTLIRRIQRRMQILQIDSIVEFIEILKQKSDQLQFLLQDFLISVTEFFRDPETFKTLETIVVPKLLMNKGIDNQIRIWVTACATGEEAYSVAILIAEAMQKQPINAKVIIFATDIDNQALLFARNGRYLASHLEGVSPERRKRWFIKEGEQYLVSPQIREMCIFSLHSVIKDPPFSKLDLICCRNLLIYFDIALQDRLIPIFHYALRPGGFLFLGPSENIGRQGDFFKLLDEKHKLFTRSDEIPSRLPHFPLLDGNKSKSVPPMGSLINNAKETGFERGARHVMERYSPAHVVIDRHYQILSFSGQTGKYLDPSPGAASLDFFQLIQKALRPAARSLVQQAITTQQRVVKDKIPFEVNHTSETVTLVVEPILPAEGPAHHYIVVFQHLDDSKITTEEKTFSKTSDNPEVEQLKSELLATKARLQAALDEAEEANDELKSTNEEFQSMNEELQSSNEELETSKEETQSINEELHTVNMELQNKNQILQHVNNDLQNLLESTQIATLFLDNQFCIRNFTPAITGLFHLRQSDIGRPVFEISTRLSHHDLKSDVQETLRTLATIEREVYLDGPDKTFMMHVRPYKTMTQVVEGAVITFVDISERKRQEVAMSQLAAIVESSLDAIIGHTLDGIITS